MFFQCAMGENTIEDVVDKVNIRELIEFERYCRDYQHWEEERGCFHDDAQLTVSWMSGGVDQFIEGSSKFPSPAKHKIFNTLIWKKDNRAVAECIAAIQVRCTLDDDLVDSSTHTRLHYRVEKRSGIWKIFSMDAIYEKDTMVSAYANGSFTTSKEELSKYRQSYANMILRQVKWGGSPNEELAGEDRPETVVRLYEESSKWLGI